MKRCSQCHHRIILALLLAAANVLVVGCPNENQETPTIKTRPSEELSEFERLRDNQITPTPKTLYAAAEILAAQGRDAEAGRLLTQIIQEHPDFIPAYNSLAEVYMRQGGTKEAIDTLAAGREVAPNDPVLANNLGMCWLTRGDYERALEMFSAASGIAPENARYRGNMAVALGLMGRQEESLAMFKQILPAEQAEHNARILIQPGR